MADKIPARFRKTKTDKWAVMAPVTDLEEALAGDGVVEVTRRDGNTSTFTVASLGKPFDVDGVKMCYGYGPEDESEGSTPSNQAGSSGAPSSSRSAQPRRQSQPASQSSAAPQRSTQSWGDAPFSDPDEPMPEYKGGPDDEWDGF